jgi:hypothetical protein
MCVCLPPLLLMNDVHQLFRCIQLGRLHTTRLIAVLFLFFILLGFKNHFVDDRRKLERFIVNLLLSFWLCGFFFLKRIAVTNFRSRHPKHKSHFE